jgi:hypothetical protein
MNGVMSKKDGGDYRPPYDMVMFSCCAFPFLLFVLFCFVSYCFHAASHIGYLIFTIPLRHSFFFSLFFYFTLLGVLPSPCGL